MAEIKINFSATAILKMGTQIANTFERIIEGGKETAMELAEEIKAESLKQVPRSTSTLADTAFVEILENDDEHIRVRVGYGGNADKFNPKQKKFASEYMVPVHERLDRKHPIGKAKFLEDPVNEISDIFELRMQEEMRNRAHVT